MADYLVKKWHTREESGLYLDRALRWWHDGVRVEHPKLIAAFERGLRIDDEGRCILSFGWDWCVVELEGPAFRVKALVEDPKSPTGLCVELSNGAREPLDPSGLALDDEGALTCEVLAGRATARFDRDAQASFGERLEERGGTLWLRTPTGSVGLPPRLSA